MKRAFNAFLNLETIAVLKDHEKYGFESASDLINAAVISYVSRPAPVLVLTDDQRAYLLSMARAVEKVPESTFKEQQNETKKSPEAPAFQDPTI